MTNNSTPSELSLEQLRFVLALSEQIVCGIERTFTTSGIHKKNLARLVLTDILEENGLHPSASLINISIESSFRVMQIFEPYRVR